MDQLWSPWRSQYISTFGSDTEYKGCIFCDVLQDDDDDARLVVQRHLQCITVMNLYPYNSGHLLIVPNMHVDSLIQLDQDAYYEMMDMLRLWMQVLQSVMRPQGFNIGTNIGRAGGAGIDAHVHIHIVPRWYGDVNFMPVVGNTKVISEDMRETMLRLREQYHQVVHSISV